MRLRPLAILLAVACATPTIAAVPGSIGPRELSGEPSPMLELESLQERFQQIAERVSPSVVSISSSTALTSDALFAARDFTGPQLAAVLEKTTRVVGTGFCIDVGGIILTSEHVIGDAERLWVTTDDGRVLPALVLGTDPRSDIAILRVPAELPALRFAEPDRIRRGDWSVALGNPLGLATAGEMSVSVGVISAINRTLPKLSATESRMYSNLIQTTAQVNPGSSGGPLVNLQGEVVGIVAAVVMPQKNANGVGFALPTDAALLARTQKLQQGEEIVYGYLGVMVSTGTDDAEMAGARVDSIEPDTPAALSLRPGDLITAVDGQPIADGDTFIRLIGASPVEKQIPLSIRRDGKPLATTIALRKRSLLRSPVTRDDRVLRFRGVEFIEPPPGSSGVVARLIAPDSPLRKQGLRQSDRVISLSGKAIADLSDLQRALVTLPPTGLVLEVAR